LIATNENAIMTLNRATYNLRVRWLSVRSAAALPFFCHPVKLFCFVWIVMLATLSIHVSESSYPTLGTPLGLFALSLLSMAAGYLLILLLNTGRIRSPQVHEDIPLDIRRLRVLNLAFLLVALLIVLINLKIAGLPPAFSFFSFDTKDYLEYGKLKQILFPFLVAILVNASLDPSYCFKFFFGGISAIVMGLYLTRLNLMFAAFQIIILFAITSRVKIRNLYIVAAIAVLCALMLANLLGNNRTSKDVFMEFLQIKPDYRDAPMPFLWAASYFSIPISDMSWIAREYHHQRLSLTSLYPVLPVFLVPDDPHQTFIRSDARIIDGAHTYLATYFMDFSFAGVAFINVLIGIASGHFMAGRRMTSPLGFSVLLAGIMFIFFFDLFSPLSTLILVIVMRLTEVYAFAFRKPTASAERTLTA